MRDRGKREVEGYYNNNGGGGGVGDCYGESFPEFPCKKHPGSSSSSGGICAYCLTDRLYQLVCPQCGEQRLPSCSCNSDYLSSNFQYSSSSADFVGSNNSNNYNNNSSSVGRISFLLENDQRGSSYNHAEFSSSKPKTERKSSANMDDFVSLRRSNSTCVADLSYPTTGRKETKEKFWKIGKLFRKKKEKPNNSNRNNQNNNDQENYECNGVSRSRSMCSFRGFYDTEESGNFAVSSSAARASSVSTGNFYVDSAKMSCFSESEARFSNFDYFDASGINNNGPNNKNIYSLKEAEFMSCDDPAYIDLKLHDMSSDSKVVPDLGALRRSGLGMSTKEFGFRGNNHDHEMFRNGGGSCRRSSVTERELRKCRKSYKVWKWFFRHQSTSANPDDLDHQGFNP